MSWELILCKVKKHDLTFLEFYFMKLNNIFTKIDELTGPVITECTESNIFCIYYCMWGPKNPLRLAYKATFESSKRYRYDMLIWPKMGYNIISNISRILEILYHIIYPNMRYYIRYRHAMIYIFPTTVA